MVEKKIETETTQPDEPYMKSKTYRNCDAPRGVARQHGGSCSKCEAVRNIVARVDTAGARGIATTKYENCGRRYGEDGGKYLLTPKRENEVAQFVKMWRNKKFCTC